MFACSYCPAAAGGSGDGGRLATCCSNNIMLQSSCNCIAAAAVTAVIISFLLLLLLLLAWSIRGSFVYTLSSHPNGSIEASSRLRCCFADAAWVIPPFSVGETCKIILRADKNCGMIHVISDRSNRSNSCSLDHTIEREIAYGGKAITEKRKAHSVLPIP